MTEIKTEDERVERAEGFERDIRIAIYNAGRRRGMGQDPLFSFIQRAMDEPTMKRALAALSLQDELVEALEPFARAWVDDDGSGLFDDETRVGDRAAGQSITFGNLRAARSLLTRIKSERDGI